MTPKEKAKELFEKYVELSEIYVGDYESEKEMCLIAIDEVLSIRYLLKKETYFYKEVKKEIEKL